MADTKDFYFKLFAREYLTSGEIRELPLEAQGILPRLWSVCCLEGSMPADLEDLSIAAGVKLTHLRTHLPALMRFFCAGADGRLFSRRMEQERESRQKVSAGASKAAKAKWDKKKAAEEAKAKEPSADANADANAHAAIVHSSEPQVGAKAPTSAGPRKRAPKARAESPETLEGILGGGKGTPTWEAYWRLVGIFGPGKNPAPKTTAKLYAYAVVAFSPEHIHEKAQALARSVSSPQYLPQLAKWLEGEGYRNPDPTPQGAANGNRNHPQHHRSGVDAAYIAHLEQRPAAAPPQDPDPELRDLWAELSGDELPQP